MRTSIQHIANHIVSVGNWKPDCCGKQDFDLPLISTSCRYYPDNTIYASVLLYVDGTEQGDYIQLAHTEIKGETESAAKTSVEEWFREQISKVVACTITNFSISDSESERVDKIFAQDQIPD